MTKLEKLEQKVETTSTLLDEVANKANKELLIAKHKITCLMCLSGLLAILGTIIAIYSIYSQKQLFYDMQIEDKEIVEEENVEQNTDNGNGSNYYLNESDNNNVGK